MKKNFFYAMLIAAGALTSCSSEDAVNNGGQAGDSASHYLSVNIVSTPQGGSSSLAKGSRAVDGYDDGTAEENKISKVRFYFFDSNGGAVTVQKTANANYYEWDAEEAEGTDNVGPVGKKLQAVLLINTKNGDALPAQIVAVANPSDDLGITSLSLKELRDITADYAEKANSSNTFVMCNSVYADSENKEVAATKLTSENFQTSQDAAKNKPVKIYVERNVAKVRVSFADGLLNAQNCAQAKTSDGTSIQIDGKDVYVKFGKWNIANDLNNAYLSKHINTSWTNADIFGADVNWNDASNFRSYWASALANTFSVDNQWKAFREHNGANGIDMGAFKYCNENAEPYQSSTGGNAKNTQVIIPAQLVDADGYPLTIYEFASNRHIATADLKNLKSAILTFLQNHYSVKTTSGNADTYRSINEDDLVLKTATEAGKVNSGGTGKYRVYARLTENAKNLTWVKRVSGQYVASTAAEIENDFNSLPTIKVWNEGATYYYFDIKALNGSDKNGVVRNHFYDSKLTAIYGIGTPVYKQTEDIIPEKPNDEDTYVAAQVNVLSWRLVANDYSLDWGK